MRGRAASRSWRLGVVLGVTAAALLMVGPVAYGFFAPRAAPNAVNSDPVAKTTWSGYGIRGPATAKITEINASWVQPNITCPSSPSSMSEAIGAGLNHYAGPSMDGVGTLAICILGVPSYFAWVDKAPAPATIIPGFTVLPGDIIAAYVSTTGYALADITNNNAASAVWSVPTQNYGECVVMRGTDLGLPAVFHPITPTPSTHLTNPVSFGSFYTNSIGCTYLDAGSQIGIGMVPGGFIGYTFEMKNPNNAHLIVPGATVSGYHADDSFVVP